MNMDFRYVCTQDDLHLMGVHYIPQQTEMCVLMIHGMAGNIMENYFGHVIGKTLVENNIGFLFSHNRGYNHTNDIATSQLKEKGGYKTVRLGVCYEIFEDCLLDIDAWINEVKALGYKKIILMGHSLGCNKVIYYFSQRKPQEVKGVILASPPDMVGQLKPEYQPNAKELYDEAKMSIAKGEPRKHLSALVWDWNTLSSQTFLSLFTEGNNADNLPILRNPEKWEQLSSINVPILAFVGEYDDIVIRSLQEDLDLMKSKALNAPSFSEKIIAKANHTYDGQESEVAKEILGWIKSLM